MRNIIIKKVGPIVNEIRVELKRFTFFIGPQSSGKSTIAKLISTMSWLEKEACTTLSEKVLPEGVSFKAFVEDFHRMHGYIDEKESFIKYDSEYVTIIYEKGKFTLKFNNRSDSYSRVKVLYVPSDRNIVTMPDIEKRNLESTNFRSFLFDWLNCHRHFDNKHMADILTLGVKFYYDKDAKEAQDKIVHKNGCTYEIPLYDASSGLQSVVPLYVLIDYLTTQYFEDYKNEPSFEIMNKKNELLVTLMKKNFSKNSEKDAIEYFHELNAKSQSGDLEATQLLKELAKQFTSLVNPNQISFIIEEPEQNLYPQSQVDILSSIIAACKRKENNTAVITTHSPYIINYLNVLLRRKDSDIRVSSSELGVYLINGGDLYNLMMCDSVSGLWAVDTEALSVAMNEMYREFQGL